MVHVLAAKDEFPPEVEELDGSAPEPRNIEELAFAIGAMIVMNRNFGESEAGILEFLDQFEADGAAVRLEVDNVENLAANQPKVAIDIA